MTDNADDMRGLTRALFNTTPLEAEPPLPPEPTTAPVIPGQEARPTFNQGPTAGQRFANQLFSAGTAREYN